MAEDGDAGFTVAAVLFQAVSAGSINVATWPGGLSAASTASAPSAATSSADWETLTHQDTGLATPSTSDVKGASYFRW